MVDWLRNNQYARWVLTIVRIYVGWQWLSAGLEKVASSAWVGSKAGTGISGFLHNAVSLSTGAHPEVQRWYAGFLKGFALPGATFFSYLVSFGELLVGIALILGLFTTFATFMGMVMNFAFLLAGTSSTNPNLLFFEIFLVVSGFNAAYYGADYRVIPWFRRLLHYDIPLPTGVEADRRRF